MPGPRRRQQPCAEPGPQPHSLNRCRTGSAGGSGHRRRTRRGRSADRSCDAPVPIRV